MKCETKGHPVGLAPQAPWFSANVLDGHDYLHSLTTRNMGPKCWPTPKTVCSFMVVYIDLEVMISYHTATWSLWVRRNLQPGRASIRP